ncbi:MAG: hypothetical protein GTO41_10485, partial [Burkholderiales bacterium]|nr:hypothetical protein [Burkholderiales bacterium]
EAKALIEAQKQIVENLRQVDPERAKEIEAELQKMIDAAKAGEAQSGDTTPDAQANLAANM